MDSLRIQLPGQYLLLDSLRNLFPGQLQLVDNSVILLL